MASFSCTLLVGGSIFFADVGLSKTSYAFEKGGYPREVDKTPVLQLGEYSVSRYLFDKYRTRFTEGYRNKHGVDPSPASVRAWIGEFVVQQFIIAMETQRGGGERAEVSSLVEQMSRYMLTKTPNGLYYEWLHERDHIVPLEYKDVILRLHSKYDAHIVSFSRCSRADRVVGGEAEKLSEAELTRRLISCQQFAEVDYFDGEITSPFEPFPECTDWLREGPIGKWVRTEVENSAIYWTRVRSRDLRIGSEKDIGQRTIGRLAEEIPKIAYALRHRRLTLSRSELSIYSGPVALLVLQFQTLPPDAEFVPSQDQLGATLLASYKMEGICSEVYVAELVQHINSRFIRSIPRDARSIAETVKDLIVQGSDLSAAMRLGLHQKEQFLQDKHGFEGFQILDALDRRMNDELPQPAFRDIEAYYHEHLSRFRGVVRFSGDLYQFDGPPTAGVAEQGASPRRYGEVSTGTTFTELISAGWPTETAKFASIAPIGSIIGPFRLAGSWYTYQKRSNDSYGNLPVGQVHEEISEILREQRWKAPYLVAANKALVEGVLFLEPSLRAGFQVHPVENEQDDERQLELERR